MARELTVIVPTFRRPALVVEAVQSALAQGGCVLEVLVVDDAPDGQTRKALEAIDDPRVAYHPRTSSSQCRPALVRQEALPLAQGQLVAFLDDDDRIAPGGYQRLVDELAAHPDAAMAFGKIEPFGATGAAMAHEVAWFLDAAHRARRAQWSGKRFLVASLLFDGSLFVTSAAMFRRARLTALGLPDLETDGAWALDLAARAARAGGCRFVDQLVAHFRVDASLRIPALQAPDRLRRSYQAMHRSYRARHGFAELAGLKIFARTLKRWL